ncbi:unnamed protein product [Oppiella nova]|uniref:BRCT domain-containing protein n=1 Tax=Oppiella nova TaxID=334625 RepID=A0A7R9LFL6_9ACAR|nr:unnamed protein product [Oppiella nova]CAG2163077.1 unnamed protein product [Oppiella nova]
MDNNIEDNYQEMEVKREMTADEVDDGVEGRGDEVTTTTCESPQTTTAEHVMDTKIRIYCIETKTFKSSSQSGHSIGRQPKTMQMAFTAMKSHKFDTNWINEDEVVSNEWSHGFRRSLFILDSFDGRAYEFLRSRSARVVGPLSILFCYSHECVQRFKNIPEKPFPLFSQCMRKLFVSISGFDGQRKRELIARIERMCGHYSKDYTRRVTHLVTDSVRTKKYRVAKQCGSAVMSSHWVDDCWNIHQHDLMSAADPDIVGKYKLKIFNKLLITVSQVDLQERNEVQEIVNSNGGVYSPSLKLNANNCILLLKEASGDKFKYAQMKGIPCLDVQWLYDSLGKGFTQSEEKYIIRSDSQQTSHQKSQKLANNSNQLNKLDSNVMNQSTDSRSDTKIMSRTSITSVPNTETICHSTDNPNEDIIQRIDDLIKNRNDEPILEGCEAFLFGFKRPVFEAIKSALLSSGCFVLNEFKDTITHVIVGPDGDQSEVFNMCANKSCKIVTIGWLYQCLANNECCDSSAYEMKRPKEQLQSNGSQAKRRKTEHTFEGPLTVVSPKALKRGSEDSRLNSKYNHMSIGVGLGFGVMDVQWDDSSQSVD